MGAVVPFDPAVDARLFALGCTDAVALAALAALTETLRREAPRCDLSVRIGDYRALPRMLASGEVSTALAYLRDDPSATAKVRVLRHSPWVMLRDPGQPPLDGLDDFCARLHALVTPAGDLEGFVDDQLAGLDRTRRVVLGVTSFALLLPALRGTDLVSTVPDFVGNALARIGGLAIDPCPVAVPPITNTMAWRATADRDPAERWFRASLAGAFAAA